MDILSTQVDSLTETHCRHICKLVNQKELIKKTIPFSSDTRKLTCPKCGHSWKYKGKGKYSFCPECRKIGDFHKIKTGLVPTKKGTKMGTKAGTSISDDIMRGNMQPFSILPKTSQSSSKLLKTAQSFSNLPKTSQSTINKLTCPKCGHSWKYKGNNNRAICKSCRKKGTITWINTGIKKASKDINVKTSKASPSISSNTSSISDDIMRGNIIDEIGKEGNFTPKRELYK